MSQQISRRRLLRERAPSARIYHVSAYPTGRDPQTKVYLKTIIPAMVTYILGPDWEKQLGAKHTIDGVEESGTEDEVALGLRILQAGGSVVDLSDARGNGEMMDLVASKESDDWQKRQKYMFGWPADGGVWVLELPPWAEHDPFHPMPKPDKGLGRYYTGNLDCGPLKNIQDMEGLCPMLERLGAKFYKSAGESKEVKEFGLFDVNSVLHKRY